MEDYKEKTIAAYNKHVEYHTTKFAELIDLTQRKEFGEFMDLLLAKKILDLGCGGGDHSLFFLSQGLEVTAIDLSEEMVNAARSKGVSALLMDIEDLRFEGNTFDGIWAVTSLLHIPKENMSAVASKLFEILKVNGILYICVKEGEGQKFVQDKVDTTERFFSFWKTEEILNIFGSKFQLIENRRTFYGPTVFLEFFFRKI